MFIWSVVGELDVVTTARGRVISEGQIKSIQSSVSSSLKHITVKEGDIVKKGDVLFELEDALYAADVDGLNEKISQLEAELSRLRLESGSTSGDLNHGSSLRDKDRYLTEREVRRTRQAALAQKQREFTATLESRKAALASGQSLVEGLELRVAIANEKEQRALAYIDIAVPRFQYFQWKDDALVLQKEISTQRLNNTRLAREIEEAEQRLLQVQSIYQQDVAKDISEKRSSLAQLNTELVKAKKRLADCIIRAPEDGVLQNVLVTTVGAAVSPNDALARLVPTDARLVIEVLIPNEEKGHMQAGQLVAIKFDAFPFQKYGSLKGKLEWISPDAELSTTSNISLLTQSAQLRTLNSYVPQYVYRGRVEAQAESNTLLKLAPGLTAQVDIYTDRRRILDFFLFPLKKVSGEALLIR